LLRDENNIASACNMGIASVQRGIISDVLHTLTGLKIKHLFLIDLSLVSFSYGAVQSTQRPVSWPSVARGYWFTL